MAAPRKSGLCIGRFEPPETCFLPAGYQREVDGEDPLKLPAGWHTTGSTTVLTASRSTIRSDLDESNAVDIMAAIKPMDACWISLAPVRWWRWPGKR